MVDEGYVKYASDWIRGPAPDRRLTDNLETWRSSLYAAGLIGYDAKLGVGYGNLSVRNPDGDGFVISGTQTGHLASTARRDYALVTAYDIDANSVSCTGPVQASSESLTHGAIYELDDGINAVVHVHSRELWHRAMHVLPTTAADVAYGTPEMAYEFARLYGESDFAVCGLAVMAGHEDGVVSVGCSLEEAARRILQASEEFR